MARARFEPVFSQVWAINAQTVGCVWWLVAVCQVLSGTLHGLVLNRFKMWYLVWYLGWYFACLVHGWYMVWNDGQNYFDKMSLFLLTHLIAVIKFVFMTPIEYLLSKGWTRGENITQGNRVIAQWTKSPRVISPMRTSEAVSSQYYHEQRVDALARKFSEVLLRDMDWSGDGRAAARLRLARMLNRQEPADSIVCHTHDFCDANESMAEAFHAMSLKTSYDLIEGDGNFETPAQLAAVDLWNEAWNHARANGFYI